MPVESKEIPLEAKAEALGATSLAKVESAYRSFSEFLSSLKEQHVRHGRMTYPKSELEVTQKIILDALHSIKYQEQQ
jgi:hypothetical protein